MNQIKLKEVDRLEIAVLVDNFTDLLMLESSKTVRRALVMPPARFFAEHGFSLLIKTIADGKEYSTLLDTGGSTDCLFHNVELLKIDFNNIQSVVLSHGHFDHFGGLIGFLKAYGKDKTVYVHPDVFLERRLNLPGTLDPIDMSRLDESALISTKATIRKTKGATTLAAETILLSGEIERTTDFEKGFPLAQAKIDNQWIVDPFYDDQALGIHVKNRGLVVIGGCSHAGIINTIKYLQKKTGIETVHAVLGGFHLTGAIFEPIIQPTIEAMKELNPQFVFPMHCTGWTAIKRFSEEMKDQFTLTTVGTTYLFQ